MSEQNQSSTNTKSRGRYWFILILVALISGFGGVAVAKAFQFRHAHFWGGPKMMHPTNIADAREMAGWMVRRLSGHIKATPAQKTKLTEIAKATVKDLFPLREKMIASRRQAIELLRQPTIDREAIEKLRAEKIQHIDILSRRLAKAIGDAAEVLTPEQRKDLAADISFLMRHRHGWHR
jgi:Spy/CpxP family protein refolding chaperone